MRIDKKGCLRRCAPEKGKNGDVIFWMIPVLRVQKVVHAVVVVVHAVAIEERMGKGECVTE